MRPYFSNDYVTIYNADCRDVMDEGGIDGVDLVVTDPPYASGARRDADRQVRGGMLDGLKTLEENPDWFSHDAMTTWGFGWFVRSVYSAMRPRLPEGAHLYTFTDWRMMPTVYGLLEACGYRVNHGLVWDKDTLGMGTYWRNAHECIVFASHGQPAGMLNRSMGSVLTCRGVPPAQRLHPTEKPAPLLRRIIAAVPGRLVFDPFCGSGSTLRAAADEGRRAIGCELEERHCETAARRFDQAVMFAETAPAQPTQAAFDWMAP